MRGARTPLPAVLSLLVLVPALSGCTGPAPRPHAVGTPDGFTLRPPSSSAGADGAASVPLQVVVQGAQRQGDSYLVTVGERIDLELRGPDALADVYAWDFGDGARTDGPRVTHTYAAEGRFDVNVHRTDNGQTGRVHLQAQAAPKPGAGSGKEISTPFEFFTNPRGTLVNDSAGDADAAALDLLRVVVDDDSKTLFVNFTLKGELPAGDVDALALVSIVLNGDRYEGFRCPTGDGVWDEKQDRPVPGAKVGGAYAPGGPGIGLTIPMNAIAVKAPYELHAETRVGESCTLHGRQAGDRAPDSGDVHYVTHRV